MAAVRRGKAVLLRGVTGVVAADLCSLGTTGQASRRGPMRTSARCSRRVARGDLSLLSLQMNLPHPPLRLPLPLALQVTKGPCAFLDARDVLVVRPAASEDQVDPIYDRCQANLQAWYAARASEPGSGPGLIVATGFIARDEKGIQTTLKRDGSDLSAAIFASLVRAKKCTIWTDVDGVYSADPRKGERGREANG